MNFCEYCKREHEDQPPLSNGECPIFRWGAGTRCPSCGSWHIERQDADEGRPFYCKDCSVEFYKDSEAEFRTSDEPRDARR